MPVFERSLDIALSIEAVETPLPEVAVIPLTAPELTVVKRGLDRHIGVLFKGIARRSDDEHGIRELFNFLSNDVDRFRHHSQDVADVLDPDAPEPFDTKAMAAIAIASLKKGAQYQSEGAWPKKKKTAEELGSKIIADLMDINSLDFFEQRKQYHRQAMSNLEYWINELKKVRTNPYVERLREAIDESDHYLFEV